MKTNLSYLIIFLLLFASACKQKPKEKENSEPVLTTYKADSTDLKKRAVKNETFYGILTPREICSIFERLGVRYDVTILNPTKNKDLYVNNSKTAINMGIYGSDLAYFKVFGIGQGMINYLVTMRDMSNSLGIPDSYFTEPIQKIQNDVSDPDTIMTLISTAYKKMEDHLKANEKASTSGLVVMGSWVEAMYIATQTVYNSENPDPEVVQKIAEQKFTLNALLDVLKNYPEDPTVVSYSKKLDLLKTYFDTFDVLFDKKDLEIDSANKVIHSTGSKITATVETINKIKDYVSTLRTEMVTP
jgi:hypothetical protein